MKLLLWLVGVRWLRLRPGDLLVVETPTGTKPDTAEGMAEQLRAVLPVGVRALVVPHGMRVRQDKAANVPPTQPPTAPADRR